MTLDFPLKTFRVLQQIQEITDRDLFLRALWEGVLVAPHFRVAAFAYIRKIVDLANATSSPAESSLSDTNSDTTTHSSVDIDRKQAIVVGNAINNSIAARALVASLKDSQVMVLRGVLEVLCSFFTLDSGFVIITIIIFIICSKSIYAD